jgi:ribulose-5-phosphate 4-epimerase/fuculose-1-phosphate aldolase
MDELLKKYTDKLVAAGLADAEAPLLGGLDDELIWNRKDNQTKILSQVFEKLNINSLLCCRPAEPYASLLDYLTKEGKTIHPSDTETRTFLHDLPVIKKLTAEGVIENLQNRKSVIVQGGPVVTFGTVSPEQAFVTFSSVMFASFVKFFADVLKDRDPAVNKVLSRVMPYLDYLPTKEQLPQLAQGPFQTEEAVYDALIEAGQKTVQLRLVDSFFGNISYLWQDTLYISQTTSSLDELSGCIDPIPLDGSSSAGITASSELSAHLEIVAENGPRAVLHGHPKFAVIMSLICPERAGCKERERCHTHCPKTRFIQDVPIVCGEVGTGKYGLCNTLPPAVREHEQAIVFGHGVFTVGELDFNQAFLRLAEIERLSFDHFYESLDSVLELS